MTFRSVAISIFLLLAVCVAIAFTDHASALVLLTGANHLPQVVVFVIVVFMLVVNPLLRLVDAKWVFSQAEMIVIWCVMAAGVGVPAFGLVHYMLPFMVAPFYYSTNDSRWAAFYEYIPDWLVPSKDPNSDVVTMFYEGAGDKPYPWHLLQAWVVPFFAWGIVFLAFFVMVFCITAILRKQWVEHERLSFPLAQIPFEITRPPEAGRYLNLLFRSPITYVGAAVPLVMWALQTLNGYYPNVPFVREVHWGLTGLFMSMTGWKGLFRVDFLALGVAFLLSTEVSLSLWLFFIIANVQSIARIKLGHVGEGYVSHQQIGGFLMFAAIMLWTMRRHLKDVFRKAFTGAKDIDDSENGLSYRFAVFGLIGSVIVTVLWLSVLGCPVYISLLFLVFACVVLVVLSRFIAQCGLVLVQTSLPSGPLSIVQNFTGNAAITPKGLAALTFHQAPMYGDPREIMMPSLLNNAKLAEKKLNMKALFAVMLLGVVLAYPVSYFTQVATYYKHGPPPDNYTIRMYPEQCMNRLATAIKEPTGPFEFDELGRRRGTTHTLVGAGAFALVYFLRSRLYWWPIHPVGILTAQSFPLHMLFLSILLGWLCKTLARKYASGPAMAKIKRFFLGMIVGAATSGMLGALVQLAFPK